MAMKMTPQCQENKAAARKFRAGTGRVMNPTERQAFLKNSEYGKVVGVADKFMKDEKDTNE